MKKRLYLKFLSAYAILAVLMLFVVTTLGRQLFYDRAVRRAAEAYYTEANTIAGSSVLAYVQGNESLSQLHRSLSLIASTQNLTIRIISQDGTEIINTSTHLYEEHLHVIEGFDYAAFGPQYYEISTFYGQYGTDHLNVMVPVMSGLRTRGYVALSRPLSTFNRETADEMRVAVIISVVNFVLSLILLLVFSFSVYHPLQIIITGAREFASGNLTHRIKVRGRDEMGYLADSLNMMAADIRKNRDYQNKFISNVSHDFRSPLTSIKGFTEAMTDGTIPPEMHDKYLKIIASETERLEKLTKSIMTLNNVGTDRGALTITEFDINAMLKKSAAVFEGTCRKKKISISLVLTDHSLLVRGDREKLEQVIYNLLDNAVKFSDRNSEIKIETTLRHGKCYVSVRDEGVGIPRDDLTRIWDRFYKSDASRGKDRAGTGLGLSIVKEIIQAHGQTISVVSTEGVGTEFVFSLEAVV